MKLWFDEDIGRGVPDALLAVDVDCEYVSNRYPIKKGTPDEDWIPYVGTEKLLVVSCNREILRAEAQRNLWIQHEVGGVFLTTGQERKRDVLLLILRRYDWFEQIDAVKRPFAFTTTVNGRWQSVELKS